MSISLRCTVVLLTAVVAAGCDRDIDSATAPPGAPGAGGPSALIVATTAAPQVVAGGPFSCALRAEGTIACWGQIENKPASAPAGNYTQLDAGDTGACAISSAGEVACWGRNEYGQASAPAGVAYAQVSMGSRAACAVRGDGSLACWGSSSLTTPPSGSFTDVAVGYSHACAVRDTGALACWGADDFQQISGAPVAPAGRRFTQVATGIVHSCALLDDGSLRCWGANQFGQINVPVLPTGVRYTQVDVSTNWFAEPAYAFHSCAVRSDGMAVCWGSNIFSQLGPAATPPAGAAYTSVTAGTFHTCVSRSDGEVRCWGQNNTGQALVPSTLNLLKRTQTITFTTNPDPAYINYWYQPKATGGGSGNPVVITFGFTDACLELTPGIILWRSVGTCTVTATQAGNTDYEPATPVTQTVTILRRPQSITFTALPAEAFLDSTVTVAATGGESGNPVTFSVLTPATCSLSGTTLRMTSVGPCTVAADQAGDAIHEAGRQTATIAVRYKFTGFVGISAPPVVNQATAGRTVSLIFTLGADRGVGIFAAGSPSIALYTCGAALPAAGSGAPTSGTLDHREKTNQYTYKLATNKAWANQCGQLTVRFIDGTTRTWQFRFVK